MANENKQAVITAIWENPERAFNCQFKQSGRYWESLRNDEYNAKNCRTIIRTREKTRKALEKLGFEVTDSKANFLFARHPGISGGELYAKLKERGILVRHFDAERIRDYNRISIGTEEQMDTLVQETEKILNEK